MKVFRLRLYVALMLAFCLAFSSKTISISKAERNDVVLNMSGYHQTTGYTCGSASSMMVLYYCGCKNALDSNGTTNDKKFHEKYRVDTATQGIQMADIVMGLNEYLGAGTYTYEYNVTSEDQLINIVCSSLGLGRPVIASVYWYGGHYVVICGIYYESGTAKLKIKDPAQSAEKTVIKSVSEFYASMPYPGRNNHPIIYGCTALGFQPRLDIRDAAYPSGKIAANQSFTLKGTILSNEVITSISGAIYYLGDNTLVPASSFSTKTNPAIIRPNTGSASIDSTVINTGLKFGELSENAYRYELSATTASGYTKILVDSVFTVGSYVLSSGVSISPTSCSITMGHAILLTATINPSNATAQRILWRTSDDNIAEVDTNGAVVGISPGTVTISAESIDGNSSIGSCVVTVKNVTYNPLYFSDFIFPSATREIEEEAFYKTGAKSIYILDGVNEIGSRAFADSNSLEGIYIPPTCTNIAADAFRNDAGLTIFGVIGSYAETFANQRMISFLPVQPLSQRIQRYLMNYDMLYSVFLDVNKDGKVNSIDYILARRIDMEINK